MSKRRAWQVTLSAIFAGIVIAIIQNKVSPCLPVLQSAFSIDKSTAGWLSSIFCVMSILVAFPAAIITNRLGVKMTCFFSLLCGVAGSILGIFSTSVTVLMVSRIVEGVGAGLISIAVPSIISMWFPPERRGLPTGLWSSWQFVAQALCFFFGAAITESFGWQGIWWCGLGLSVLAAVLCVLCVRAPDPGQGYAEGDTEAPAQGSIWEGLKSRRTWAASISMFCFCFSCFGFVTWAASCWSERFGLHIDAANRYVSLFALISLPVVVLAGLLIDHVDHYRFGILSSFGYVFAVGAAFLLPNQAWILPFVLIYPFFEGSVSTCLWTIIPQTATETRHISIAVALFTLMSNVGMLAGPPVVGAVVERLGWMMAVVPVALAALVGTISIAFARKRRVS